MRKAFKQEQSHYRQRRVVKSINFVTQLMSVESEKNLLIWTSKKLEILREMGQMWDRIEVADG